MLKTISLHAILILKQTLRRVPQVQRAYRYFSQTLDSLIASHHHRDNRMIAEIAVVRRKR